MDDKRDDQLIEAVRSYPCLWQVSSKAYKDLRAKKNAWKEVAEIVGGEVTVEDCLRRWKSLRDRFVREIKKAKKKKSGEEGPAYVSCWPHFKSMMFVADTVKHRSTSSNFGSSSTAVTINLDEVDNNNTTLDNTFENEDGLLNEMDESPPSSDTTSSGSNTSSTSSRASSPAATTLTSKKVPSKKGKGKTDEIDELLVRSLHSIQENQAGRNEKDEEGHYGEQVAATLRIGGYRPRQAQAVPGLSICLG